MVSHPDILIIHPDSAVCTTLAHILGTAGYRVTEATSGDEGLRLAAECCPSVALVALALPDRDGPAVCRALRSSPNTRSVLCALIAAAPPAAHEATAQAALADAWIVTPVSATEVLALVRLLLRVYAAEQRDHADAVAVDLLYQEIVQTTLDGFWIIRASDARFLAVNEAYCRMSGYSRAELLTMTLPDIEAIERPQETAAHIERLLHQRYERFESRHRRKDGTNIDVEVNVRLVERDERLFVVFARDITATKQAEATLRRSEARYRSLLNALPDRVFRHDAAGHFIDYHAPNEVTPIMPPEAFLGKHYREVVPSVISEPLTAALARAYRTGELQRFEYDLPLFDGTLGFFEARVVVGEDNDALSIVRNITEQRQAQRTLHAQHKQFLTIFDAFPEMLYVVDPATDEVLFVNKVFQDRLGHNPVGGVCYRELQGFETRCSFCTNEIILRTRQPYTWEQHNQCLNLDLLLTDQIIRWPDGRDVRFELAVDITARKQAEAAQERLGKELARKNRELEQIVYVASHDLRSPLVNVQGFSHELQSSLDELRRILASLDLPVAERALLTFLLEEDLPESLRYILTSVSKMDALLKGLLRLSRLGRAALSIVPLDVGQLIAETLVAFDFEIKHAGVAVEVGPLPPCRGDAVQVGQIFANLISNALKYLAPTRPGQITITGDRAAGMTVYGVADNGLGIAADQHEKIFELYYRLDPTRVEGDGLGLTIVRTIVDRHSGWVRVVSTPGVGSQFLVALPEVA